MDCSVVFLEIVVFMSVFFGGHTYAVMCYDGVCNVVYCRIVIAGHHQFDNITGRRKSAKSGREMMLFFMP